jgi:hypothetical protein
MITKNDLIAAINGGMHPEDIYALLDEATKEVEAEKDKEMRSAALMDGMMAYVGRDHKLWNHMDPYDALDSVMYVLDELMAMDSPVANDTKEKCSCGEDCSCEEKIVEKPIENKKIVGKVTTFKDGVKTEKELTEDEVDNIFATWLKRIG